MTQPIELLVHVRAAERDRQAVTDAMAAACDRFDQFSAAISGHQDAPDGAICQVVARDQEMKLLLTLLTVFPTGFTPHESVYQATENEAVVEAMVSTPLPSQVSSALVDVFATWLEDIASHVNTGSAE